MNRQPNFIFYRLGKLLRFTLIAFGAVFLVCIALSMALGNAKKDTMSDQVVTWVTVTPEGHVEPTEAVAVGETVKETDKVAPTEESVPTEALTVESTPTEAPSAEPTEAPTETPVPEPTPTLLALPYSRAEVESRFEGMTFHPAADVIEDDGSTYKRTAAERGLLYAEVIGPDEAVVEVHARVPVYLGQENEDSYRLIAWTLMAATKTDEEYADLAAFVSRSVDQIAAAVAEGKDVTYEARRDIGGGRYALANAIFATDGVLYMITVSTMAE